MIGSLRGLDVPRRLLSLRRVHCSRFAESNCPANQLRSTSKGCSQVARTILVHGAVTVR